MLIYSLPHVEESLWRNAMDEHDKQYWRRILLLLGENVRCQREHQHIPAVELASRMNTTVERITAIENAAAELELDDMICLATALHISITELMEGVDYL